MIHLKINFHEEPKPTYSQNNSNEKKTFTARECYNLIKKYKKAGLKVGSVIATKYSQKPFGRIVSFISPPKEGITIWGTEPPLIEVEALNKAYEASYRSSELILCTLNKTTGEYELCSSNT